MKRKPFLNINEQQFLGEPERLEGFWSDLKYTFIDPEKKTLRPFLADIPTETKILLALLGVAIAANALAVAKS